MVLKRIAVIAPYGNVWHDSLWNPRWLETPNNVTHSRSLTLMPPSLLICLPPNAHSLTKHHRLHSFTLLERCCVYGHKVISFHGQLPDSQRERQTPCIRIKQNTPLDVQFAIVYCIVSTLLVWGLVSSNDQLPEADVMIRWQSWESGTNTKLNYLSTEHWVPGTL